MFNVCGGDLGHDCTKMRCDLTDVEYREYLRARYGFPGQANIVGYVYQVSWITKGGYITAPAFGPLFDAK